MNTLIINTDGGARGNPGPAGIGAVLCDDSGEVVSRISKFIDHATNNIAEYLAVIFALQEAVFLRAVSVTVKTDSQLIARQIRGEYKVKDKTLRIYHSLVLNLLRCFDKVEIVEIPREDNKDADKLVNDAIDSKDQVFDF